MAEVNNPWLNISWDKCIADIDYDFLCENNIDAVFDMTLPEPYTGSPSAVVYCLGMNPGEKDCAFESIGANKQLLLEYTKKNLSHSIKDNMWYDLHDHAGYCWWRKRTSKLRKELNRNPFFFNIEFYPYHSKRGFNFPSKLPSYAYSDALIKKAMKDEKFILILRHKTRWLNRIENLKEYPKLFYIDSKYASNLVIDKEHICKGYNCKFEIDDIIAKF